MRNRSPVLVASDDPTTLDRTVGVAVSIAKDRGAEVHALHLLRRGGASSGHTGWSGRPLPLRGDTDAAIASRLSAIGHAAERDGVRFRVVPLRGEPASVIPAYGQLHDAAMLVIDSHYASSPPWRTAGVVRKLARRSPMPLLVLPSRQESASGAGDLRAGHVLLPVDFSVASAVAVKTTLSLMRGRQPRVTLLHAVEKPVGMVFSGGEAMRALRGLETQRGATAERLRRSAARAGATAADVRVVTGDAGRAILEAASQLDADLVVLGVAPRSWLHRAAFGSTVDRILGRINVPVLVVPSVEGAHEPHDQMDGVWRFAEDDGAAERLAA